MGVALADFDEAVEHDAHRHPLLHFLLAEGLQHEGLEGGTFEHGLHAGLGVVLPQQIPEGLLAARLAREEQPLQTRKHALQPGLLCCLLQGHAEDEEAENVGLAELIPLQHLPDQRGVLEDEEYVGDGDEALAERAPQQVDQAQREAVADGLQEQEPHNAQQPLADSSELVGGFDCGREQPLCDVEHVGEVVLPEGQLPRSPSRLELPPQLASHNPHHPALQKAVSEPWPLDEYPPEAGGCLVGDLQVLVGQQPRQGVQDGYQEVAHGLLAGAGELQRDGPEQGEADDLDDGDGLHVHQLHQCGHHCMPSQQTDQRLLHACVGQVILESLQPCRIFRFYCFHICLRQRPKRLLNFCFAHLDAARGLRQWGNVHECGFCLKGFQFFLGVEVVVDVFLDQCWGAPEAVLDGRRPVGVVSGPVREFE